MVLPITEAQATDASITRRIEAHEAQGLRYCYSCPGWYDDTDCYPADHSRHCGHQLKPLGSALSRSYRLICTGQD